MKVVPSQLIWNKVERTITTTSACIVQEGVMFSSFRVSGVGTKRTSCRQTAILVFSVEASITYCRHVRVHKHLQMTRVEGVWCRQTDVVVDKGRYSSCVIKPYLVAYVLRQQQDVVNRPAALLYRSVFLILFCFRIMDYVLCLTRKMV